jgi:hypothetical protein
VATIKQRGLYPCPRCLVTINDIYKLGLDRDRHTRKNLPRVDSQTRCDLVEQARKKIIEENCGVENVVVKALLNEGSLVPTSVLPFYFPIATKIMFLFRMHFPRVF